MAPRLKIGLACSRPAGYRGKSTRETLHVAVALALACLSPCGISPDYSCIETVIPPETTFASAAALQLVMRMQPLDAVLPILDGSGVP